MKNTHLLLIALFCIGFSLQQVFAAKIAIKTLPKGADIFVSQSKDPNAKPIKLGVTPYESDIEEVAARFGNAKTLAIEVKKDGFNDENLIISSTGTHDVDINIKMAVGQKLQTIQSHDILMQELFVVQKMIRAKNFEDALKKLDLLEQKHRDFSIISELKAITYYMKKDVEKALSYFRQAFALNPENVDAYKMKVYIEKKLGIATE